MEEPYKYPARFGEELQNILKEEVERVREELVTVEERAEEFKKNEDQDKA